MCRWTIMNQMGINFTKISTKKAQYYELCEMTDNQPTNQPANWCLNEPTYPTEQKSFLNTQKANYQFRKWYDFEPTGSSRYARKTPQHPFGLKTVSLLLFSLTRKFSTVHRGMWLAKDRHKLWVKSWLEMWVNGQTLHLEFIVTMFQIIC